MNKFEISKHAEKRIKERMGLPRKAQLRMIEKVVDKGLKHGELVSHLHDWVTDILLKHSRPHTFGYIYNSQLFLIRENVLITVIPVPGNLQKHIKLSIEKKKRQINKGGKN